MSVIIDSFAHFLSKPKLTWNIVIFPGDGKCSGSTPELAYNYVADVSARNISGVFNLDDLPYSSQISTCNETIDGVTPSVGIEGWTELPSNDYKSVMNALAKVRSCFR